MTDGSVKPRHKLYIGVAASAALHLLVVGAFFVRLPTPEAAPPEESVSVEIVPPPEQTPAPEEAKKPEEQALDLTMPEEKAEEQKQDIPPPPEPPTEPAEEAGGEPPPPAAEEAKPAGETEQQREPEQQQAEAEPPPPQTAQAQAEPPPPPPPEPAAEPEQPPAAPEQSTSEDQSETPPGAAEPDDSEQQAHGQPLPVLRPVIEFGEEDAGPEVAPDGDAAEQEEMAQADVQPDGANQPEETAEEPLDTTAQDAPEQESGPSVQDAGKPDEAENDERAGSANADETQTDESGAPALPQDVAPPSVDADPAGGEASGSQRGLDGLQAALAAEPKRSKPADKTPDDADAAAAKPLKEAKRLFSQKSTSDAAARTAMGTLSRDIRASQLCTTELKEQLLHGSPAFNPEILPSYRLPEGTVMDIRQAAFRANDQWYNVRFRCEINDKATKVVSFAVQVGDPIPRTQWRARGFPDY
jgi:hypothetical protein